ncbi:hypothetical protein CEE86_13530, partial [Lactobacillus crispatus]|uniref:hypothetical protein n=1 Tax=Lactobacillus crispatus TaxID=47770 RepID=UPI00105BC80E
MRNVKLTYEENDFPPKPAPGEQKSYVIVAHFDNVDLFKLRQVLTEEYRKFARANNFHCADLQASDRDTLTTVLDWAYGEWLDENA